VVVGSGPNGLAAAVTLARAGVSVTVLEAADRIGGGARTAELTVPGVRHDVCSAFHPLGVASPFLTSLPLREHGLEWCRSSVDVAHPLDGDRAAMLLQSLDATAAGLGADGDLWRRRFGPLADRFDALCEDLLAPVAHRPRHPVVLAGFARHGARPATGFARRLSTQQSRALFAGCAAHLVAPLTGLASASVGTMLIAACHAVGWPVAKGGSESITSALAGHLSELGGRIETGVRVTSLAELADANVSMIDTSPSGFAAIARDLLPARLRRSYERWRYGPAAFKIDLAVEGGVPWRAGACREAGVVHVGGVLEDIVAAEAATGRGIMPERPFVLVGQQYLADPGRSSGNVHPVWAYAHVPHGYPHDVTDVIIDQIERFAPGVRDRIVARHVMSPRALEDYNSNYVGGDIATGANDVQQLLIRPRLAADPYATGIPGVYLCSAATPPGAGVHGMCGHHAATRALRYLARSTD
jgi:phytoene dehydrogenase-like protein